MDRKEAEDRNGNRNLNSTINHLDLSDLSGRLTFTKAELHNISQST
jgi:hypothetical protein